jgi:signal transduction histidine kinase
MSPPDVGGTSVMRAMRVAEEEALRRATRAHELQSAHAHEVFVRTDRMFAVLMIAQWAFAIFLAFVISPYSWEGRIRSVNVHVFAAIFLGALLLSLPLGLVWKRPGWLGTRLVIGGAQILWSALLIHLTGGRIETHFHVFGSLAFLAFYRDWKVLVPATLVTAGDHLIRQIYWPESVYGVLAPEWWRFLEHAGWVVFEDIVLVAGCIVAVREMAKLATQRAEAELLSEKEQMKSLALDRALAELQSSQESLVRTEKLAAVGQLAASVGHELRNPLSAVRNAATYVTKRLGTSPTPQDAKVQQFLGIIDREVGVCTRIISDLLDFASERPAQRNPCPLRALLDEAISVLPASATKVENEIPADLDVPSLDKEQFRQVVINLLQNAVEAMEGRPGVVRARAEGNSETGWKLMISDEGAGMPPAIRAKIFEPLFTTKTKGTGLGLAVVANLVRSHGGTIEVATEQEKGTTFTIELPGAEADSLAGEPEGDWPLSVSAE